MRSHLLLTGIVTFCLQLPAWAQVRKTESKSLVKERFEYPLYEQTFDSSAKEWTVLSNTENLLIMQDGEYILQRKSKLSPFAVIGEIPYELKDYRFLTSLKLVKTTSDDGSIGCIFMAQENGRGGFIFEINPKQEYRLRQIIGSNYEYLTGTPKDGGWSKSSFLKPVNMPNLFEVRTFDKKYDIYLNNNLLLSFTEIAYNSGSIGFIIGPGSMGKVDFLYVFTNDKDLKQTTTPEISSENNPGENDVISLAESIIDLKSQLNKLQQKNAELTERIESFQGMEQEQVKMKSSYEARISSLEKKINQQDKSFDSLLLINADLGKYKEMVKGNESGDVVISLSKNLKVEKLKSDELSKQNQALKDSVRVLQSMLRRESSGNKNQEDNRKARPEKENNVFALPKEN